MNIYDMADQFRRDLLRKEKAAAGEMVTYYGRTWQEIRGRIVDLTARMQAAQQRGEWSPSWIYQQERLSSLLAQTEGEIRQFASYAGASIVRQQRAAVEAAQEHARQLTFAQLPPDAGVSTSWSRLPIGATEHLVGTLQPGSPLRDLLDQLPPAASADIKHILVTGTATGQGAGTIARHAQKALGGNLDRALTISRTETLRSYRGSSIQTMAANADVVDLWRWVASKSARTCPACLAMDGKTFPLDVPLGSHPNCRCTAVPVTKSWADLGFPELDDEPAYETGEEWFDRQSVNVQVRVLGPAAASAYRAGEVKLSDFVSYHNDPKWGPTRTTRALRDILGQAQARGHQKRAAQHTSRKPGVKPAKVKPASPPPSNVPVSAALQIPKSKAYDAIRDAIAMVDQVHDDGKLPTIPIDRQASSSWNGAYRFNRQTGDAVDIKISKTGQHDRVTTVHETGHFLDHQAIGKPGTWASVSDPIMQPWRDAVDASQAVKDLRALKSKTTAVMTTGSMSFTIAVDHRYAGYLLDYEEIWARAYAQFIATQSGNGIMAQELDGQRQRPEYQVYPVNWQPGDFAGIEKAILDLLKKLGWKP